MFSECGMCVCCSEYLHVCSESVIPVYSAWKSLCLWEETVHVEVVSSLEHLQGYGLINKCSMYCMYMPIYNSTGASLSRSSMELIEVASIVRWS